ncbi:MAG TPA: hypothetical protein VJ583_03515 [Nitrososphaeraceae archaeon]|nr:hypothetical protein [Nitrososphaeraceae archaeon]
MSLPKIIPIPKNKNIGRQQYISEFTENPRESKNITTNNSNIIVAINKSIANCLFI